MNELLRTLEEFGLTEAEAKVYLALLKKGTSLAGVISKETGIHRRTIYDILYRLRAKGLISNIVLNNNRHFEAAIPERLLELIKEKENNIKERLPELKLLFKANKEKKEVVFFKGKQALKTVFDDQIKEGKEILSMGKFIDLDQITRLYFKKYDDARIEKKIELKSIFDEVAKENKAVKKIPLIKTKFLPNLEQSNLGIYIYGSNVTLVLWEDDPLAIMIRQKEIADGFKTYFNILWKSAKQ